MTFQQREYGRDVPRSDLLKQLFARECRYAVLDGVNDGGGRRFRLPDEGVFPTQRPAALPACPRPEHRRPQRADPTDVQCCQIGFGVETAVRPHLLLKEKAKDVNVELAAFKAFGQFDISSLHLPPPPPPIKRHNGAAHRALKPLVPPVRDSSTASGRPDLSNPSLCSQADLLEFVREKVSADSSCGSTRTGDTSNSLSTAGLGRRWDVGSVTSRSDKESVGGSRAPQQPATARCFLPSEPGSTSGVPPASGCCCRSRRDAWLDAPNTPACSSSSSSSFIRTRHQPRHGRASRR